MIYDNNYVTIDLDAIRSNVAAVREKAGVQVMGIIKADAYGHGAVQVARCLEDLCAFFGVSCLNEALELRRAGITIPILLLGHTPVNAYAQTVAQEIRVAIFDYADAAALSEEACRQGKTAFFHFALDTGMSRIGFQPDEAAADQCAAITALPGICAEGIFSHFATADSADLTRAQAQAARFDAFLAMLRSRGVTIPVCHLNNSAGVMNFTRHYDLVRSGIVTYGLYPSDEVDPGLLPLTPAMAWYSHISHVKTLPAGREIGYGGTYTTTEPTRVATIPTGYADGYRRSLSGKFYVLIHGKKAPILGRVCMDQLMVDVTNIPEASAGDRVVLLGKDGKEVITAEQIAGTAGSFNYEFVCGISRRVPRYYLQNGKIVHSVNYLLEQP